LFKNLDLNFIWKYIQLMTGAVLGAISVIVFLVPADVVPQGLSGLATVIAQYINLPLGVLILLFNIPILYLGYRMLPGGWRMIADSAFVVVMYSVMIEVIAPFLPTGGYSDDRLLNTVFGGIIGGISGGIVYRTGTNYGGTSVLALIMQRKLGLPLSQTFLYTDTVIIAIAGLAFGIEGALYAMIVVFLGGITSDYVMEGPSVIRTVVVLTNHPEEISSAVMERLERGVTSLSARGMYSGNEKSMLYIIVSRAQVNELRQLIAEIDERAFVVVGRGQTAYGEGFKPIKVSHKKEKAAPNMLPLPLQESVLSPLPLQETPIADVQPMNNGY
jgi:uncharacterized membrane-anchored protein YitT (DUF2179 family)